MKDLSLNITLNMAFALFVVLAAVSSSSVSATEHVSLNYEKIEVVYKKSSKTKQTSGQHQTVGDIQSQSSGPQAISGGLDRDIIRRIPRSKKTEK